MGLLGQLDDHHGTFVDSKHWTMVITGILCGVGLVVAAIALCSYLLVRRAERLKEASEALSGKKGKAANSRVQAQRYGRRAIAPPPTGGEIECRQQPNLND